MDKKTVRVCPKCGKEFQFPSYLKRHLSRKTACDPIVVADPDEGGHPCKYCGRTFTTLQALSRHSKHRCKIANSEEGAKKPPEYTLQRQNRELKAEVGAVASRIADLATKIENMALSAAPCAPGAHPTNIGQLTINAPVTNIQANSQNIQTNIIALEARAGPTLPGWPTKWPPPEVDPKPFMPSCFAILPAMLSRAVEAGAKDAEACKRGEPGAVAELLVGLMKQVHADPTECNIYKHPNRADQVIVRAPRSWDAMTLKEGTLAVFDRTADELAEAIPFVPGPVQDVARAARKGYYANKSEVVKNSRSAVAAHLENLSARLLRGGAEGRWLEGLDCEQSAHEIERPRIFGQERHGHLEAPAAVEALERRLGVYSEADLLAEDVPRVARQLLQDFARTLRVRHPENLTVILVSDEVAYVHTPWGWKARPAAEAAGQQIRAVAELAAAYIAAQESKVLTPAAEYITQNLDALAAEEGESLGLLRWYTAEAERYYKGTTGRALEEPRRLLREREKLARRPEVPPLGL
jgi:hypothetical protein